MFIRYIHILYIFSLVDFDLAYVIIIKSSVDRQIFASKLQRIVTNRNFTAKQLLNLNR